MYLKLSSLLLLLISLTVYGQNKSYIDSLENQLILTGNPLQKVTILSLLTNEFVLSDPDLAMTYSRKALNIADANQLVNKKPSILINMAEIFQVQTDLKQSIELALQAKEIAEKLNDQQAWAESNLILGNCFIQFGEYAKSSEMCFEALSIYEQLDHSKGVCNALNAIGINYVAQKIYDKALEYFKRSYEIAIKADDLRGIGRGLNNLSVVYGNTGRKNESREALYKAIEINKLSGQKQWLGINYNNLAEDYLEIGSLDSSFKYVNKGIGISLELKNNYNLATSYILLAKYNELFSDTSLYLFYLDTAYSLGIENNLKHIKLEVVGYLHTHYRGLNDIGNAYDQK